MNPSIKHALLYAGLFCGLTLTASAANAQVASNVSPTAMRSAGELDAIFASAKPMERKLERAPSDLDKLPKSGTSGPLPSVRNAVTGPTTRASFAPGSAKSGARISARNYGASNLNTIYHFSDSQVDTELMDDFPYRAVGWYLFRASDNYWYRCSASLISSSILVTAGHCVHHGGTKAAGWNKEGYFYPARTGTANPYGYAPVVQLWTTSGWYNTGSLDAGYDLGVVVLGKRATTTREIGSYTGTLGFCYANCLQPYWSIAQLGYPWNYSNGDYLSESDHLDVSDSRDFRYGTGMQGGSSGGPSVANLGALSDAASYKGAYANRNIVFAVTSWGYDNQTIMIGGSTTLSGPGNANNFRAMFNGACTTARGLHGTASCAPLS